MTDAPPLPLPSPEELTSLGITGNHRLIYDLLYARRDFPPTMQEIRDHVKTVTGKEDEQLDRRKRDLHTRFNIRSRRWVDGKHRHQLLGWAEVINPDAHVISKKVRFQVLQSGRCNKCGRTVEVHGVVLVVDHVIPQKWGGGKDISNLQPLCEDCNQGKKDHYGQFDQYTGEIRAAVDLDEPHRRIAHLMLAFRGEWVPTELIGAVASAKQYQEDSSDGFATSGTSTGLSNPGASARSASGCACFIVQLRRHHFLMVTSPNWSVASSANALLQRRLSMPLRSAM